MAATNTKFVDAKRLFFDSRKVMDALSKKERRVLSRAGAFVRRKARGLIRKRKKPSKPGSSPTNQTDRYKNSILFFADLKDRSVVMGPVALNNVYFNGDGRPVRGTVPEILETGGAIHILEVQRFPGSDRWQRADLRSRRRLAGRPTRLRKVEIKPRPHMQPAFAAELPKFPELFRGEL